MILTVWFQFRWCYFDKHYYWSLLASAENCLPPWTYSGHIESHHGRWGWCSANCQEARETNCQQHISKCWTVELEFRWITQVLGWHFNFNSVYVTMSHKLCKIQTDLLRVSTIPTTHVKLAAWNVVKNNKGKSLASLWDILLFSRYSKSNQLRASLSLLPVFMFPTVLPVGFPPYIFVLGPSCSLWWLRPRAC